MADREKVIEHLKEIAEYFRGCRSNASFASKAENHFWELQNAASEAAELLKAQEQEISRLKHHVDCDAAEKLPSGCVGYGRGFNDDEPCETCKACEKYNGYGEE